MYRYFYKYLWLFVILIFVGCKPKTKIYLFFDKVDGLNNGSVIMSRGIIIGEVTSMNLKDSGVVVELNLKDKYRIPKGSNFMIAYDNILQGRNAISVNYSASQDFYNENDTVKVKNGNEILRNNLEPISLDSSTKEKMIKVFEKIDTIIKTIRN